VLLAGTAWATSVPSLTFEQLTDQSDFVVSGQVTRSWSDWDSDHKFIWTHYEIAVARSQKGKSGATVTISEPGGMVGDRGMSIAGSVGYRPGEEVAVFLQRMPNGYLRTTGWAQGKFKIDASGHLHAEAPAHGLELAAHSARGTSLRTLEGITVADLSTRVGARLSVLRQGRGK